MTLVYNLAVMPYADIMITINLLKKKKKFVILLANFIERNLHQQVTTAAII